MLFVRGLNLYVRKSKPLCPGLGPAGTPSSDRGTVGSGLILFISGLMLFVRRSKPFCPILRPAGKLSNDCGTGL